jgi:hypothetical protein
LHLQTIKFVEIKTAKDEKIFLARLFFITASAIGTG